jgi:ABC-type dipeptide/oligopeptide/nickel transport system permease component
MLDFLRKQLILLIPIMFGVSILVFFMMNFTPGGAIEAMVLRGGAQVSGEDLARFVKRWV